MKRATTMLIVILKMNLLLLAPADALISVQHIRSSRGEGYSFLSCPARDTPKASDDLCTFASTSLATTITEDVVERRSLQITQRDVSKERRERHETSDINGSKAWELRLYNDETNFEFWVAEQLVKIVGLSEREAFDTMKLAGITGQATIGSYDCFELAEHYHTALQAEGLAVKLLPVL